MRVDTAGIYADLQSKLITAQFAPGEKIKPGDLQGLYGCSANTVRDVLLRLTSVGLVEFEIQRGFRASPTSPERRSDVARFRILLEKEGASRSIARGGVDWEAQLAAAHHKLRHIERRIEQTGELSENVSAWSDAEREFHETLISRCGSPLLIESFQRVYAQFRQQMMGQERDFGANYFGAIIDEHQVILDAALARDEAACRQAIFDHLKRNIVDGE